jgi:hypothetical protein
MELARDAGRELPDLASELSNAATCFNDVTYGEQPGTETAYRRIADLDERLRTRRPATTAPGVFPPGRPDSWAELQ